MSCSIPDCDKPVHAQGLCKAHYMRRMRGVPMSAPLRPYGEPLTAALGAALEAVELKPYRKPSTTTRRSTVWEMALEAANTDTGADSDDAYERAKDRFRKAVKRIAMQIIKEEGYRKR